jgi:hypothetical protein
MRGKPHGCKCDSVHLQTRRCLRRSEQVPDNRLREVVKKFYYLVALTLCDCATRMMQKYLALIWAKCDHLIWMILEKQLF